ncbi:M20/M25/M40 family metallo-hydrolase [Janibacter sp. Y6]|uniref:M20/M25/M40 family metallo-hydrolase n=1 Tax=Janibacter sp. Y6 TaxID=2913552 RepID=UPI0034A4EADA
MDQTPQTSPSTLPRRAFLGGIGVSALGVATAGGAGAFTRSPQPATTISGAAIPAADMDPLDLLQRMLSFDTQNSGQGGKTRPHAEMLKAVWERAGVPVEIIDTPQPDNVHLIARIPGTGAQEPLLLLGHSDVVPVERENWDVDPFAGEVVDGEVYGRGALDMKGANSAMITALLRHLDEGATFDRDIIVLTDCDEEAGSYGSGWLAENHWEKIDAGSVLTEGGWFIAQSDKTSPMLISATRQDKVYFNLELVATGTATHSSKPIPDDSAIVSMSRAISDLGRYEAPVHLTRVTRDYFEALARATDDRRFAAAIRLLLRARNDRMRERAAKLVEHLSDYPYLHRALLRTTHAFVIQEAGYKENVIPSEATTRINCRGIPGGEKPRDFVASVRRLLRHRDVEVRVVGPPRRERVADPRPPRQDLGDAPGRPRHGPVARAVGCVAADLRGRALHARALRGRHEPGSVAREGRAGLRRLPLRHQQRAAHRHARQQRADLCRGPRAGQRLHVRGLLGLPHEGVSASPGRWLRCEGPPGPEPRSHSATPGQIYVETKTRSSRPPKRTAASSGIHTKSMIRGSRLSSRYWATHPFRLGSLIAAPLARPAACGP